MSFRLELEPEDLRDGEGIAAVRRWSIVLVVVLVVMAGSAAGLWAAWQILGRHGASGTVPILRADERPVKVPPANPGGMEVPDQDMYILNRSKPVDSRVEQLLPPPETPLPRPVPPAPVVTESPPPETPPQAAPVPLAAPPQQAMAPPQAALPPPPAAAPPLPSAPPAAAPPAAAPPPAVASIPRAPAPAAPPAAAGASYRLQLGAVRSAAAAQQEWDRLKRTEGDVLGRLTAEARRIDLGQRGIFYRIMTGPVGSEQAAAHICDELKRRKVGCLLVKD